jgi:flagellar basal body rod protein FlgC
MIDLSTPLSGMTLADMSVTQIATRLARPATDTIDISSEMASLMAAKDSFAMDVKVAQTEDQMTKSTLSIFV